MLYIVTAEPCSTGLDHYSLVYLPTYTDDVNNGASGATAARIVTVLLKGPQPN